MDLEPNRGECVALLGENGAGKSNLIKVLGGAHQPDEGKLEMEGQERKFLNPLIHWMVLRSFIRNSI